MLPTTCEAIKAICAADPSITAAQIKAGIAEMSGKGIQEMRGEPPPRAYTPAQVAELLGKSRRTISAYARTRPEDWIFTAARFADTKKHIPSLHLLCSQC